MMILAEHGMVHSMKSLVDSCPSTLALTTLGSLLAPRPMLRP